MPTTLGTVGGGSGEGDGVSDGAEGSDGEAELSESGAATTGCGFAADPLAAPSSAAQPAPSNTTAADRPAASLVHDRDLMVLAFLQRAHRVTVREPSGRRNPSWLREMARNLTRSG
ncbi:hypothetical protein GCM10027448_28530 [Nocardioides dilutus]